ncbi:MAG: glycosyltransferase involved in cell wall biosynthesis, partial [Pseudohongiellaceae bacterium]
HGRPALPALSEPVQLSVAITTLNEEHNLPRCLASLAGLADQVIVLDSLSTDSTQKIAEEAGAEFHSQEFLGHVRQKQMALELAKGRWVLNIDADEWLDDDLKQALARVLADTSDEGPAGYRLNRRNEYLGSWIDHCGWSPQWRLRLVRRGQARWAGENPHDRLELEGPSGDLPGRLNHQPYRDLADHFARIGRYTDTMARDRHARGEQGSLSKLVLRPPGRFLRMYLLQRGFLDGWRGFVLCSFGAFYVFLKYAKLLEHSRRSSR